MIVDSFGISGFNALKHVVYANALDELALLFRQCHWFYLLKPGIWKSLCPGGESGNFNSVIGVIMLALFGLFGIFEHMREFDFARILFVELKSVFTFGSIIKCAKTKRKTARFPDH